MLCLPGVQRNQAGMNPAENGDLIDLLHGADAIDNTVNGVNPVANTSHRP